MKVKKRSNASDVGGIGDNGERPIERMAGSEAQVDRIVEKLGQLRGMDAAYDAFGAKAHRYRLGAVIEG